MHRGTSNGRHIVARDRVRWRTLFGISRVPHARPSISAIISSAHRRSCCANWRPAKTVRKGLLATIRHKNRSATVDRPWDSQTSDCSRGSSSARLLCALVVHQTARDEGKHHGVGQMPFHSDSSTVEFEREGTGSRTPCQSSAERNRRMTAEVNLDLGREIPHSLPVPARGGEDGLRMPDIRGQPLLNSMKSRA